jgi:hypothetical protein
LFSRQLFSFGLPLTLLGLSIAAGACIPEEIELRPAERPPRTPSAQEETANVIGLVKAAQPAPDGVGPKLKAAAEAVFERSFGLATTDQGAPVRPVAECSANGCFLNVVYPDRCSQLRADAIFSSRRSPIISQWPGSVTRTPPIKQGNSQAVSVTWALFITPDRYRELDRVIQGPPDPPPPPPVAACSAPKPSPILDRP